MEARNRTGNGYGWLRMDAVSPKSKLINGWEVVIGMEVHAQVTSRAKLFSGASTEFGGEANSHVSLVDAAMPGMLPVINAECVRQAVRTGLGLKAQANINLKSVFERKHYFYPDLPQGYQISQYKSPIVGEGEVTIGLRGDHSFRRVRIERLHLEQDAGKSLHERHQTLIDLNRSGVALMEIVTKPDLSSAEQAMEFLTKLRSILRYLGTCDGDMEKGSLRADVNVSVRRSGEALGTRCEIKNINSIRFIGQAIEHEARRQIGVIEDGGKIEQETRLFDPVKGETRSMRSKEEAHDYRYFPDPDLLPVKLDELYVAELDKDLPELPDEKEMRFTDGFGLSPDKSERLVRDRDLAERFEEQVYRYIALVDGPEAASLIRAAYGPDALKLKEYDEARFFQNVNAADPHYYTLEGAAENLANVILGPVMAKSNEANLNPAEQIERLHLPEFLRLILDKTINSKIAQELFEILWTEGGDPRAIVRERGLQQVTDVSAIEKIVDDIVARNPDKLADARTNPKAIGWFVGQVMKASGGKANPQTVNELLKKKIDASV
jgi:aspartyl-tRNA(Asn)/glutamyl-tRNA(Gln) amidotransferase subunit B